MANKKIIQTYQKRKSIFLFGIGALLTLPLGFIGYYYQSQQSRSPLFSEEQISTYLPRPCLSTQLVGHDYYFLGYSAPHKESEYVFYVSKAEYLVPNHKRGNKFEPDPLVKTGSATLADYRGSGYDRGHLLPAADMRFDKQALAETFYLSNISPQEPSFDQGIWVRLEDLIRQWVREYGELVVITGPILEKEGHIKGSIGQGQVTVPWAFYKVILKRDEGDRKIIAFVIPHEKIARKASLKEFVASVNQVEVMTGMDFFYELPEEWQNYWEAQTLSSAWTW